LEEVVLVNENDDVLGYEEKISAHQKGLLHRAISVLVFNKKNELLIQQRAACKYHWANIWANSCCSHPRKNESYLEAAERRVKEELGINITLEEKFKFIYKAYDEASGLIEHELDAVFFGTFEGNIPFNHEEVQAVEWKTIEAIKEEICYNPEKYAFWFKEILKQLENKGNF
jgi:isopentenyl-diphosphate delta-isomerase